MPKVGPESRHGPLDDPTPTRVSRSASLKTEREASAERVLQNQMVGGDSPREEMLLDDRFEHRRIARGVPGTLGIHDGDRSAFADAQAIRLCAQDAALLRQSELFEPPLEKVPLGKPVILLPALGTRLVLAED